MRRLVISVAVMMSGCSFVLVSGPPANHRELPVFECTTSRLGPGLDVIWTALQALNLATALSSSEAEWDENFGGSAPLSRSASIPLYSALGVLGAAGMYYGFSRTGRCRDAKAELAARTMQPSGYPTQPGAGTWPPPQQPSQPLPPPPPPPPADQPAPATP